MTIHFLLFGRRFKSRSIRFTSAVRHLTMHDQHTVEYNHRELE